MSYNSDYEVRLATLAKLGGDVTKHYDSVYEIDLAILEATGGGGSGATYTAGTGITIDAENKISVDPAVVQNKLTAGDGIEISGDTISATGGAAIEDVDVLPDPEGNKDKIVRLSTDGKLYYVDEIKAIKFTALADNSSIGLAKKSSYQTLEYFANGSWSNMTTATNITLNSGESVYVRGILSGNNASTDYTALKGFGSLKVSGNINTIWDYTASDLGAGFQLKNYCGFHLFNTFSSALIDISELILPATTLADSCYRYMFYGCDNITTSPILPAQTLVSNCYRDMFNNCSKLNKITCLATSMANLSTNSWVTNVAATGTFYKNSEMSSWTTGGSGIPNGWTIEDYTGSTPEITYDLGWRKLTQETLLEGSNISISNNIINALGYTYNSTNESFVVGIRTQAPSGSQAFATGWNTMAAGQYSVALGESTTANTKSALAVGSYNVSHNANSTYGNSGNTQMSVGIGTSANNRHNAIEIMQNGDIYAYGVGGYVGVNTKAQDATIKTLQEAIPVIVRCTQAEYEQLTPDANTIYLIVSE